MSPVAAVEPAAAARLGARAMTARPRITSIDIIRGAIMILMAVDHTRLFTTNAQFDPLDVEHTTVAYYFTRWLTHFCAPGFVFLAGTAAFLYGTRVDTRRELSWFLLTRGVWLVLMELTVIRLGWTFNLDYGHYVLGGVIWMIGWCMILTSALVYLPVTTIVVVGLLLVAGHNAFRTLVLQPLMPAIRGSGWAWLLRIGYIGGVVPIDGLTRLFVLFVIVPWIGVMALGYAFGRVMTLPPDRRDRLCYAIGGGATLLFIVLRTFNIYGNPGHWAPQDTVVRSLLSFLNTDKYPASFQFLLMTLGPTIALIPPLERTRTWLTDVLGVFGRVPFFYYLLHIPLIHLAACVLSLARYGEVVPWLRLNHPLGVDQPRPPGWGYNLAIVYLVTATVVILLYFPCRWFDRVKRQSTSGWLRYL